MLLSLQCLGGVDPSSPVAMTYGIPSLEIHHVADWGKGLVQGGVSGLNPINFVGQTSAAVSHPAEWMRGQQACTQYALQEAWSVNFRPVGQIEGGLLGEFVLLVLALKLAVGFRRSWARGAS